MKHRSRTEIVAQILEAGRKPATKTRIMYDAFLSHAQLKQYLELLEANGLIYHDQKNQVYRTVTKGLNFLDLYQQMGEIVVDGKSKKTSTVGSPPEGYEIKTSSI